MVKISHLLWMSYIYEPSPAKYHNDVRYFKIDYKFKHKSFWFHFFPDRGIVEFANLKSKMLPTICRIVCKCGPQKFQKI